MSERERERERERVDAEWGLCHSNMCSAVWMEKSVRKIITVITCENVGSQMC